MWYLYHLMLYFGLFVGALYLYNWYVFQYWTKKGVHGPKPTFLIGNMLDALTGKVNIGEVFTNFYNDSKHLPCAGIFMMLRPTLMLNDLELIKTVLIKDFIHFSDHNFDFNEKREPMSAHLFNLNGEQWKHLRTKLTPAFTSGKLKGMFNILEQCALEMNRYLDTNINKEEIVDIKEIMSKLNTDIIGSCAFGIECNSFTNPDAEFRQMGKLIFHRSVTQRIVRLFILFIPMIKYFNKGNMRKKISDFFYNIVKDTIKYRKDNNIIRNDIMQLLIQLQKDGTIEDGIKETKNETANDAVRLTTMQLAAQVFVFFIAGFETTSAVTSFTLYELSLNPDIQDKVREEIDEVLRRHNNKITYDAIGEMTYLSKVFDETLRKYPLSPVLFRVCTQKYTIPGTSITIEKDTPVMIPILGIHRDPEFFPEPDKFDPERFTPENKAARHHFSYLPFGEGPRICIGQRFANIQSKLGLVAMLSKFEVSVCDKTSIPMVYDKFSVLVIAQGGVWLKLKKRAK